MHTNRRTLHGSVNSFRYVNLLYLTNLYYGYALIHRVRFLIRSGTLLARSFVGNESSIEKDSHSKFNKHGLYVSGVLPSPRTRIIYMQTSSFT